MRQTIVVIDHFIDYKNRLQSLANNSRDGETEERDQWFYMKCLLCNSLK